MASTAKHFEGIKCFEMRRDEAFQKLYEIMENGYNKADWIEIEEAKHVLAKRYTHLAQMGWPAFWHQSTKSCPRCQGGLHYVMTWENNEHYTCIECDARIVKNNLKETLARISSPLEA